MQGISGAQGTYIIGKVYTGFESLESESENQDLFVFFYVHNKRTDKGF